MATGIIEVALSYVLKNAKGRDAKCFTKGPAFSSLPEPTISITSLDCGDTNSTMPVEYTHDGSGRFPTLEWSAPDNLAPLVKEWLLVCEDPDAPLPTPICHGIYGGINKTRLEPADFEFEVDKKALLKGGFYYGKSRGSTVYLPPRPLM